MVAVRFDGITVATVVGCGCCGTIGHATGLELAAADGSRASWATRNTVTFCTYIVGLIHDFCTSSIYRPITTKIYTNNLFYYVRP